LKILNKKIKPTQMTINNNNNNSSEENELMDQQEDSGEQTDSGISSTFTTDIEQMFADTVNNVSRARSWPRSNSCSRRFFIQFLVNSNLNCSSSNGHDMTFLNNTNNTNTTVLPDFQYLTSPSGEQKPLPTNSTTNTTTINHIPTYPIPKSVDCNQYGNNITNSANHNHHQQQHHSNASHVSRIDLTLQSVFTLSPVILAQMSIVYEQFHLSTANYKHWPHYDR
jgi:hypothetical protein